jgi:YebC/PmpR family DNA-binding regulatory protein
MSGHSKWSKVKHQKATTDVVKGAAFTKASRAVTLAVKEGGGVTDPNHNFHLRLAIEKARAVNMPKDNIERAIEKGAGGGIGSIEQVIYEAFGPGGVAFVIEAATDNRQRTVSQVKNVLDRSGGALATPGAVGYQFQKMGVRTVPKTSKVYDELLEAALAGGADDVVETDDMYEIYTSLAVVPHVRKSLEDSGAVVDNAQVIMRPTVTVPVDASKQETIDHLVEQLESLDDVQTVYTNAQTL